MTIPMSVLPEPVAATPQVRAVAPSISSAGVNDSGALARQQLPTAVNASPVIAAYAANVATPPKPPVRNAVAAPSIGFAAQFIAQSAEVSDADLALFTPRQSTFERSIPTGAPQDYSSPARVTRNESETPAAVAARPQVANAKATQQAQASAAQTTAAATTATVASATTASTISVRSGVAATTATTAAAPASSAAPNKRQQSVQTRAVNAYAYTEMRNAAFRTPENISAVL